MFEKAVRHHGGIKLAKRSRQEKPQRGLKRQMTLQGILNQPFKFDDNESKEVAIIDEIVVRVEQMEEQEEEHENPLKMTCIDCHRMIPISKWSDCPILLPWSTFPNTTSTNFTYPPNTSS